MDQSKHVKCWTCYGDGVVSGHRGPESCPDCAGAGTLASPLVLTERRLRELERSYDERGDAASRDVSWLIAEVRRSQHALVQILAASQDADENDALAKRIKYLANDVLRVYAPTRA